MNLSIISRLPRFTKVILIISISVVGISLICWAGYRLIEHPRYIVPRIPSPILYLPRGDWLFTQYTTSVFTDSKYRFFIIRMETKAYSKAHDTKRGFDSWESVLKYFDSYLSNMNWQLYTTIGYDPCAVELPESKFLPRGTNGYVVYRRPNTKDLIAEPTICLAIWSDNSENTDRFNIVLVTVNPSTITRWKSESD